MYHVASHHFDKTSTIYNNIPLHQSTSSSFHLFINPPLLQSITISIFQVTFPFLRCVEETSPSVWPFTSNISRTRGSVFVVRPSIGRESDWVETTDASVLSTWKIQDIVRGCVMLVLLLLMMMMMLTTTTTILHWCCESNDDDISL